MVSTGQAISHYEIRKRLGLGGMGEIYRAKDLTLGRDIAIKVLPEEFSLDRGNEVPFSTMETPSTGSQLRLIRTDYINFGHPSLPIYRNPGYFTMDLRLKIEILHTPKCSRLVANSMPKREALSAAPSVQRLEPSVFSISKSSVPWSKSILDLVMEFVLFRVSRGM
jgi:serine/threonine protein kinase